MSYILLRCRTGFNDCLYELWTCTKYAIQHNRKIILQFMMYSATDLNTIFDFSNYPVEIILDTSILESFQDKQIIPAQYKPQLLDPKGMKQKDPYTDYMLNNTIIDFNRNASYNCEVLLVRDGWGRNNNCMNHLSYVKFSKDLIDEYKKRREMLPILYNAVHIRATDKSQVYKGPVLEKAHAFIKDSILPVFVASDDSLKIARLEELYGSKILKSETTFYNTGGNLKAHQGGNLHQFGTKESDVLKDAIIDLLLLANAKRLILTTERSGYSRLADFLCNNKDILNIFIS